MTEDFYEALSDLYTPSELIDRLNIDFETLIYYFQDYIEDHAGEFENELPEYFDLED